MGDEAATPKRKGGRPRGRRLTEEDILAIRREIAREVLEHVFGPGILGNPRRKT